ncbi:gamma-glutamyltransferase family protein [Terrihabitans rhizophilus]|uniref:Gamma-glutamyltransferase n=1 Tax=Terrihabitans rhizophilus TaxID=3092662 RepID=A0ABU4RSP5_9HYPH|nr:gamma-glutamyltransferase [Terrihabitans sp. PJ23]MDX6807183.1 gamma-glutamyltransferase [Terrihabitans sp. PJ23]
MLNLATSTRGVVAAPHSLAVETGRSILAEGGNAWEAMIAMAATIAVTYPHMNGIGGDAFWVVREPDGRVAYIEACGPAGQGTTIDAYENAGFDAVPARGPLGAATVAGAVSGWEKALEGARMAGGRLPLDVLLSDAIGHARDGYRVSAGQAGNQPKLRDALFAAPGFADHYLTDGKLAGAGETLKQPALAATLDQLSRAGLRDFYRGDVGREMAADLERIGSPVTRDDLRRYEARFRDPLTVRLKLGQVWNAQPPTQGLAALMILGIAEQLDLGRMDGVDFVHGLVEATKRAFLVRDRFITDPRDLDHDPASFLTPERLASEAAKVVRDRALPWPAAEGEGDTVWLGAIDGQGRAVSYIQSIYWEWGSGCVLPKTGVVWQNRGAGFSMDRRSHNRLAPGRMPFHTLNPPVAALKDGRVVTYGSHGGDGQPQTQAAIFARYAGFGASIEQAITAPRWRLGRAWGDAETSLKMEPRFEGELLDEMLRRGHEVDMLDEPFSSETGHAGMIVWHPDGRIEGMHDPRADGGALGA